MSMFLGGGVAWFGYRCRRIFDDIDAMSGRKDTPRQARQQQAAGTDVQ